MKSLLSIILGILLLASTSQACMPKAGAVLEKITKDGQDFAIARQVSYSKGSQRRLLNTFWAFAKRVEISQALINTPETRLPGKPMARSKKPNLIDADGKKIDLSGYDSAWSIQTDIQPFQGNELVITLLPKGSEQRAYYLKKMIAGAPRGIQPKGGCGPHF